MDVAAFSRLHPLFPEQGEILAGLGTYEKRWRTASIDLTGSPEQQLAVYEEKKETETFRFINWEDFCSDWESRRISPKPLPS